MFRLTVSRGMLDGKRRFSTEVSSKSSERGHERPAFLARSRYSLMVALPTPQLCAACLTDRPFSQQRRKISFIFLIDSLVFATACSLSVLGKSVPWHFNEIDQRVLRALSGVAGFNHIWWPLWVGIRTHL